MQALKTPFKIKFFVINLYQLIYSDFSFDKQIQIYIDFMDVLHHSNP